MCPLHHVECAYRFFSPKEIEFEPMVICRRIFRDNDDMINDFYARVVSNYYLLNASLVRRQVTHWGSYYRYYQELYRSKSQMTIAPMTTHRNEPTPTNIQVNPELIPIINKISDIHLRNVTGMLAAKIRPGTLADACKRRLHWGDMITKEVNGFPQVFYTQNMVSPATLVRLGRDFNKDGALRGDAYIRSCKLLPNALRILERNLECDNRVGTVKFKYDFRELVNYLKIGTSGGIFPGHKMEAEIGDTTYKMHNSGQKLFHCESSLRRFHRFMMRVAKKLPYEFQPFNVISIKGEWKVLGYEKKVEELCKYILKLREFFIPNPDMVFLSTLLGKDRMYFERGNMIRIGNRHNYGGNWELFKYLNGDNPDIFWADGDVTSLDKGIKDWQLYLYIASGIRYYDRKNMNAEQKRIFNELTKLLMYHISNKVVLNTGNLWRFMRGVMYSGGKETSHGDSWIMALLFWMYIEDVCQRHPHMRESIQGFVDRGYIRIVVYGDDHVWCCPKDLRFIIGVNGFRDFLSVVCDLELRDYKEYDKFLSVPDFETGGLKEKGVRFLKRYFIKGDDPRLAPVLPYKPVDETMLKLFCNEDELAYSILKAIGCAWDTMGTNPYAYNLIEMFYHEVMAKCPLTPSELFYDMLNSPKFSKRINNYVRLLGLSKEQLFEKFPSYYSLRMRHVHDPQYCKFGNKGDWQFALEQDLGVLRMCFQPSKTVPYV